MSYFKAKCTKFDFGWGSAPDPAGGAYSAPSGPVAELRGPSSKGRKERGRKVRGRVESWYPHFLDESYAPEDDITLHYITQESLSVR